MSRDYLYPRGTDSAKIVQVIETTAARGDGTEEWPSRRVVQYWDFDGNLLAENDPLSNFSPHRAQLAGEQSEASPGFAE